MKAHIYPIYTFLLGCFVSSSTIALLQTFQKSTPNTAESYQKENPSSIHRRTQISNGSSVNAPNRMLIGVLSMEGKKDIRDKLREYIFRNPERADPRLCSLPEFMQKEAHREFNECQVVYTFVIGANPDAEDSHRDDSNTPILVDQQNIKDFEEDVTYLNIRENMDRGKSPTWFKYASGLSRSLGANGFNYISKLDDDVLMSIPDLLYFVDHELPSEARNVYGGVVLDVVACNWSETCQNLLQGKIYMSGQFYFMSLDLASYVSDDALDRAAISNYVEDLDMALWVHSSNQVLNLFVLNNKNVFWLHRVKKLEEIDAAYKEYFVQQRNFPAYTFWKRPRWY